MTLVGGFEHLFFHINPYVRNSNPNQLIFFRGVETTNHDSFTISQPVILHKAMADSLIPPIFRCRSRNVFSGIQLC